MSDIIVIPEAGETQSSLFLGELEGSIFNPWLSALPDKSGDPFVPLNKLVIAHFYWQVSKKIKQSGERVHLDCGYPGAETHKGDQIPSVQISFYTCRYWLVVCLKEQREVRSQIYSQVLNFLIIPIYCKFE